MNFAGYFMLICRCYKRELQAKIALSSAMNTAKQSDSPGTIHTVSISCSSFGVSKGGEGGREDAVSTEHLSALQLSLSNDS